MTDTAKLLDRVRKLLALAESPNVHEAALAAARAQQLIERHRLEHLLEEAAPEPFDDGTSDPLEVGRRVRKWKTVLAAGLAALNGCVAYTAGRKKDQRLLLAGRPADRQAVIEVWSWLCHRIELLSATEGPGMDRAWHDAFRIGAADTILRRMKEGQAEAASELPEGALVRVQPALERRQEDTRRYAQDLGLRPGRRIRVDVGGYEAGQKAGEDLPL